MSRFGHPLSATPYGLTSTSLASNSLVYVFSFFLMSSEACYLKVIPKNIEFSSMGLSYPTLPIYAQSVLDRGNGMDLDDLIDGINLTLEWGEENLNLEGTVNTDWILWKYNLTYDRDPEDVDNEKRTWYSNPDKRREIRASRPHEMIKKRARLRNTSQTEKQDCGKLGARIHAFKIENSAEISDLVGLFTYLASIHNPF